MLMSSQFDLTSWDLSSAIESEPIHHFAMNEALQEVNQRPSRTGAASALPLGDGAVSTSARDAISPRINMTKEEVSAAEVAANGGPSGRDPRATKTLLFGTSETAGLSRYTFAELATMSFENIRSATFAFDSDAFSVFDSRNLSQDNEQFYLASALLGPSRNTGVVPLPAGLPLLLAGLGAFGVMSRRRKAN